MRRFFSRSLIALIVILWTADVTLMPVWFSDAFRPVCSFFLLLYAAMIWRGRHVIAIAMALGLLRDLAGVQPFGVSLLAVCSAAFFLLFVQLKIERQWIVVRMLVAFVFSMLVLGLELLFSAMLGQSQAFSFTSLRLITGSAIATSLGLPVFIAFAGFWFHDRGPLKQYPLFQL